uniref:Reverse transcriptase zinc-binding domain-containing protein n=1 Tax=Setaria viridis TaxID=4556 RepID=A0A4U6VHY2_SETVI|nr:hypothetical protein SEVIR_3G382400v2 [Setaria viridis]
MTGKRAIKPLMSSQCVWTKDPKTTDHILVNCSYAKQTWWEALTWLGCACTFQAAPRSLQDWWAHVRTSQLRGKRRGIGTLFMLIIWSLWKEHNARLFHGREVTVQELLSAIRREVG